MRARTLSRLLAATAMALALLLSGAALAQPQWDRVKGDCDKVLGSTTRARRALGRVGECTELFLTHRDTTKLSPKQRRKYRRGFSVLFYKGDDDGRENSHEALKRLGSKPLDRAVVFPDEAAAGRASQANPCKDVASRGGKANRTARSLNKKGLSAYRRKRYRKAIGYFERAMRADPGYLEPFYNAACNYAMLRDARASVELLREIKGRCGREPRVFLSKAHTDRDFRYVKKDPSWRQVTGYVEILVLNGAGPEGEPHVSRIKRDMATMGRRPAFVGTDKYARSKPHIYYRPAFKDLAERLKDVVSSPGTKLKEITFNTAIKKYNFDLILVWGMPHRAALREVPKVRVGGGGGEEGGAAGGNPLDAINSATGTVTDTKGAVDGAAGAAKGATAVPQF